MPGDPRRGLRAADRAADGRPAVAAAAHRPGDPLGALPLLGALPAGAGRLPDRELGRGRSTSRSSSPATSWAGSRGGPARPARARQPDRRADVPAGADLGPRGDALAGPLHRPAAARQSQLLGPPPFRGGRPRQTGGRHRPHLPAGPGPLGAAGGARGRPARLLFRHLRAAQRDDRRLRDGLRGDPDHLHHLRGRPVGGARAPALGLAGRRRHPWQTAVRIVIPTATSGLFRR